MNTYASRRNVFEAPSLYGVDSEGVSWRRPGKPDVVIPLSRVRIVRLVYGEGMAPFWVADIKGGGKTIKLTSLSYLGPGNIEDHIADFVPFIHCLDAALTAAGRPGRFRFGSPLVTGIWVGALILLALFELFAIAVVYEGVKDGHWGTAVAGLVAAVAMLTWSPSAWRSIKANRPRPADLSQVV